MVEISEQCALTIKLSVLIGKHSSLGPPEAMDLASKLVKDLDLHEEVGVVRGLDYLSMPTICRWVTGYFKR